MENKHKFELLDLRYMQEISRGDISYERRLANVFIETIPEDLLTLKRHFDEKSIEEIKKISHHMQSSLFIMGLEQKLSAYMEFEAYENADGKEIKEKIAFITKICMRAVEEAKVYLKGLA
ncbi:MAG: hypothetical protein EOO91_08495 [Pedobacter sp.]|nr:MAG: hypothetical protein EOO91_08495 [Pedobacter sp.]